MSCAANKENALSTGRIETPTSEKLCKNDCPKGEWCSEDCVCQGRFATPRCGDGYISSIFVGGGGVEECDLGGKNGIPAKPDTCTEGKVCQDCKCVEVTDLISETCPQGTGPDSKCGKGCYPSDACEVATYTKN
ncbi:MAG: hypothetical protein Q7K43_06680, partial [Candidatus Woesearchaeota archaeon]|nr:hypothetical protein [Candidatus Woesearchaeota archaeon]